MTLAFLIEQIRAKRVGKWLIDLAYLDQARLIEWLSLCWLLNFAFEFLFNATLIERDSYREFSALGLTNWASYTLAVACFQLAAIFWQGRWRDDLRFCAMTFSFAFWVAVTLAFWTSGVQTTANLAYATFSISTLFAAGFLLWKSTAKG